MTRRTAVRGAAWTASAVTIVLATPDIACASVGGGLEVPRVTATTRSVSLRKKKVIWNIAVTSDTALANLTATFGGVPQGVRLTVRSNGVKWRGKGRATRTLNSPLAAGETLEIRAVYKWSSHRDKVSLVSANFTTGAPPVNLGGASATVARRKRPSRGSGSSAR